MQTKLVEMREETKRKIGEVDVVEREVESLTMEVSSYVWRIDIVTSEYNICIN
jgi:hypothetical protein